MLPLVAGPALGDLFAGRSSGVVAVGNIGLWVGWLAVLIASLVPTASALTALRLLVPVSVVAAVAAATAASVRPIAVVVAVAVALAATILAFSAEVAQVFIQGSAYGDETRFPLRPPGPLLLGPLPLGWALTAAAALAGPLLLAARVWVPGTLLTGVGVGLVVLFARRCHRLARRFVVFVPAGVVVHDPLILGDTFMARKTQVASLALAEVGTQAADLTGKALGNAVEISLRDFDTVVLAASPGKPGGSAIHAKALLISPSRPGRLLTEATRRGHRLA
jgi:hypothetical protein